MAFFLLQILLVFCFLCPCAFLAQNFKSSDNVLLKHDIYRRDVSEILNSRNSRISYQPNAYRGSTKVNAGEPFDNSYGQNSPGRTYLPPSQDGHLYASQSLSGYSSPSKELSGLFTHHPSSSPVSGYNSFTSNSEQFNFDRNNKNYVTRPNQVQTNIHQKDGQSSLQSSLIHPNRNNHQHHPGFGNVQPYYQTSQSSDSFSDLSFSANPKYINIPRTPSIDQYGPGSLHHRTLTSDDTVSSYLIN